MKNAVVSVLWARRIAAQARNWARNRTERASKRPSTGALSAWVSGTPKRAGPMMATVSSIAATLAPKPSRSPRRSATRARAVPPASAIQNPPVGATREARKETVATCAGPAAVSDIETTVAGAFDSGVRASERGLGDPAAQLGDLRVAQRRGLEVRRGQLVANARDALDVVE